MRLIDADLFVAEIKERITNAIQWGKNATKEEIKIRAEQAVATFSEASLTARKMPTVDAVPLEDYKSMERTVNKLTKAIAEAEPVRHGHWCVTQAYPHTVYCSECFQRFAQAHWAVWEDGSLPRDYCPHCGAKMDGERKEDAEI